MYLTALALALALSATVLTVRGQIWSPDQNTTWQWQLLDTINTSVPVDVYDIDLFDATDNDITTLKSAGKNIICYFSAGSYEDWRDDAYMFPNSVLGNDLHGWAGERWIDVTSSVVRSIMSDRLDYAKDRGCDAVEPDNVDGYANDNGLGLTYADQLDYNLWLANQTHQRNMSVGLKNAGDMIGDLHSYFDWALNEECVYYNECGVYKPFIDSNKAVLHVEYVEYVSQGPALQTSVCSSSERPASFSTLIKEWDLYAWYLAC